MKYKKSFFVYYNMNNQLNLYSDKNIHFSEFQYEILDDIAKIKPSLDGMYNIDKTNPERPFLQDLAKMPPENLLGQNVNGANSPIAEQVKSLNNETKINGNIIIMTTDKSENYDSINMSELSNNEISEIEKKIKEFEEKGILNNTNVNNIIENNTNNNNTPSVSLPEQEVIEPEVVEQEVIEPEVIEPEVVDVESNINKTFRDLFHKTVTNKIILFLFLVVIGILFSVYKKKIMKLFA
jgi:hypothetical protein